MTALGYGQRERRAVVGEEAVEEFILFSSVHHNRPRWRQGYPRKVQQEFQFNRQCIKNSQERTFLHNQLTHTTFLSLPSSALSSGGPSPPYSPDWPPRPSTTALPRRVMLPGHQFMCCCRVADKICRASDPQFPPVPCPCEGEGSCRWRGELSLARKRLKSSSCLRDKILFHSISTY